MDANTKTEGMPWELKCLPSVLGLISGILSAEGRALRIRQGQDSAPGPHLTAWLPGLCFEESAAGLQHLPMQDCWPVHHMDSKRGQQRPDPPALAW